MTTSRGIGVRDGVTLVLGAAVAATHMRALVTEHELSTIGWVMVWLTFAGVAITAAGPFLYIAAGRPSPRRHIGQTLWAMLGLPWLATPLLRPVTIAGGRLGGRGGACGQTQYAITLWVAVALVSVVCVVCLWRTFLKSEPDASPPERNLDTWTERVGLALAVAWPLQWGFALVVTE